MQRIPEVRSYMTPAPLSIRRERSLAEAERLMKEHDVRHLPVVDENAALVGVLSARELQTLCRLVDADHTRVPVDHAAAHDVFTVAPDAPLADVCTSMAVNRCGCAVVIENHQIVGILTTTDVCRTLGALLHERAQSAP